MKRDEIRKLLGGYATGTLTEEERSALFAAAIEDQKLYDALANEDSLRELLADPAARRRLLAALGQARPSPADRAWAWLRQPGVWALAGGLAAAAVVAVIVVRPRSAPVQEPQLSARMNQAAPAPAPAPPPEVPAKARRPRRAALQPQARPEALAALPEVEPPPTLRYTVLRKGEGGLYTEDGAADLHPGDSVRLRVEPQQSGRLMLSEVDSAGTSEMVYEQPVVAGGRYLVPPGRGIELGGEPGEKKLLLMLANAPAGLGAGRMAAMRALPARSQTATPAPAPQPVTVEIILKYR